MRVVIAGLGVQGRKRLKIAGGDVVATVDPVAEGAMHRSLEEIPPDAYDAALLCVPDGQKLPLLEYLIPLGKHVLVEKPLLAQGGIGLPNMSTTARCSLPFTRPYRTYERIQSAGELG